MWSGIDALREGDKRRARRIFRQIVSEQPDNADAWLYLASALDDPEQRIHCLRQVVRLRPAYAQARAALQALERRTGQYRHPAQATPSVMDGQIVGDPALDEETSRIERGRRSPADTTLLVAVVIIAMLAIIAAIILTRFGAESGALDIERPQVGPTPYQLAIGVEACAASGDREPSLVFINNTEFSVEILRGPIGEEVVVLSLPPNEQGSVIVDAGVEVRFSVRSDDDRTVGQGATVVVPQGNTCRVPIQ